MKKITLTLILLLVAFLGRAQLNSQDFNTALGWTPTGTGWSRVTTGTAPSCTPFEGAGMAMFNSYDLAANATAVLSSPSLTFVAGTNYKVTFRMFRDTSGPEADKIDVYLNTTAAAAGTLLGTVNRQTTQAPAVPAQGWYYYSFNITGVSGARFVNIKGTSKYGANIFIDDIKVATSLAVDASLDTINLNSIIGPGSKTLTGAITNMGTTAITSLDLKWQLNNAGTIYTQNLTGLNIASGASYNYSHANTWTAVAGSHSVKVWVSNINGGAGDTNASNDAVTKTVSVASGSTARKALIEKFSSSTCGPCAGFASNVVNPYMALTSEANKYSYLSYQVNWPGAGDPYTNADVATRVGYYGVSGAPTMYVDSQDFNGTLAQLTTSVNNSIANPAFIGLTATKSLIGSNMTVVVNTAPYISGPFKLHVAVVEKKTTGNGGGNGETEWHNVVMKMLPNASGTALTLTSGTNTSNTLTASLTGLHIEEMTDLEVIVFIQNEVTKEIMNSAMATVALGLNDFNTASKIKLYPNPSNGFVKIRTESPVDVTVIDLTGKVVFTMKQVANESQMNLSSLEKGMYLVKLSSDSGEFTQKIILN
jgi:hypothetical protein